MEFLNVCAECALDGKEADIVCQQAMHYVVCSTRPPDTGNTAVDACDAWSTCTTSISVREPENVVPHSSSNRGAAERGTQRHKFSKVSVWWL